MSDLVSRQAVKDWLEKWRGYLDDDMIARMQIGTKDIPQEPQWVPLSTNQLPEEGQEVFIQFKEGRHCPHFKVQVGYLGEHDVEDNNYRKIGVKKVWYTNQYYYDLDMVIAWMPEPAPYKEER